MTPTLEAYLVYLGMDIGTPGVTAVLVDGARALVDPASAALPIDRPQLGWSEQNPADWWEATNKAVVSLHAKHPQAVTSVGLSGQMHGATLLDAAEKALRPAILRTDGRSHLAGDEAQLAVSPRPAPPDVRRRDPPCRQITEPELPGGALHVRDRAPRVVASRDRINRGSC